MPSYRPMRLAPRTKGELMKNFLQGLSVREAAEETMVNKNTASLHFQRWRSLLVRAEQVRWSQWAESQIPGEPFLEAEFQALVGQMNHRMGRNPLLGIWNTGNGLLCHFFDSHAAMELPGGKFPEALVWDTQPTGENLTLKRLLCLNLEQIREWVQNPANPIPQESSHPFWNSLLEQATHIKIIPNTHLKDVVQEYAWKSRFPDWNDQLLELRKLARLEACFLTKLAKREFPGKKNAEVCLEVIPAGNPW